MTTVVSERDPTLWGKADWLSFFEGRLRDLGGRALLSKVLHYPTEAPKSIRAVVKKKGSLKKLLLTLGPQFKISGKDHTVRVSLVDGKGEGNSAKAVIVGEGKAGIDEVQLEVVQSDVQVVNNDAACAVVCRKLLNEAIIALDCEGVDLGRPGGSLCLVQIASRHGVFLFDVKTRPELFEWGLRDVLEDELVVKAVHDCKMDVAALSKHAVQMRSVFDTQVVFSVVNPQRTSVSLRSLLKETTGAVHLEKANAPHKDDRLFWQKRPLSPLAVNYAANDVKLLLSAANVLAARIGATADAERSRLLCNARVMKYTIDKAIETGGEEGGVNVITPENIFSSWAKGNVNERELSVIDRPCPVIIEHDLDAIVNILPEDLVDELYDQMPDPESNLVDVVLDCKRPAVFIRNNGPSIRVESFVVEQQHILGVLAACGQVTDANRACIGDSLHRCSVIKDPSSKKPVGLTVRMARVVRGIAGMLKDALVAGSKSVLLIGPPGRGKTTLLRDIARMLSDDDIDRRVMIVDTNNEIAGENVVPHHAIGRSRRMKVGDRSRQYRTMLEAVQNHTPETLIIDEIGMPQEVTEAVGIQQRGVQLIATTHGRTLADVIQNPHLRNLLGGVHAVILSAGEKVAERAATKTRMERKMPPAFDICVELLGVQRWRVHQDVSAAVDCILRDLGEVVDCEIREWDEGKVTVTREPFPDEETVSQLNAFEISADSL